MRTLPYPVSPIVRTVLADAWNSAPYFPGAGVRSRRYSLARL